MAGVRSRKRADKETVQTANPKGATKVVVVRITDWSLVQVQPPPPQKSDLKGRIFYIERKIQASQNYTQKIVCYCRTALTITRLSKALSALT